MAQLLWPFSDPFALTTDSSCRVFRNQKNSWELETNLLPPDGVNGDQFGHAVTISGNLIGIGADAVDDNGVDSGSAYVFDTTTLQGDFNCDGEVNLLDVAGFIALLVSGEFDTIGDINQDGEVNLLDVEPFVELLNGRI